MSDDGYVDLHVHYVPGVDDGVRSLEHGVALCRGLRELGYDTLVATPHIRNTMFPNRAAGLRTAFERFQTQTQGMQGMPHTDLSAEHYFDEVFWELFEKDEALPYPGGAAALVEFSEKGFPVQVDQRFFEMRIKGLIPVIAHPERYPNLFKNTGAIAPLLAQGSLAQLDLMSLLGKYGRRPKKAAERMLKEDAYYVACSDCHHPDDVSLVGKAIGRLQNLVGEGAAQRLLAENPRRILSGAIDA